MGKIQGSLAGELSARRVVVDGSILSVLLSVLVIGSIYYNPSIWYQDLPEELKAKVPPPGEEVKRQQVFVVVPLLLIFFGTVIFSSFRLKSQNGGRLSFRAALVHAYSLFTFFNLYDTVVLDYVLFTRLQPRFALMPGMEHGEMARYAGASYHLVNFAKGIVYGLFFSLPVAWLASRSNKQG